MDKEPPKDWELKTEKLILLKNNGRILTTVNYIVLIRIKIWSVYIMLECWCIFGRGFNVENKEELTTPFNNDELYIVLTPIKLSTLISLYNVGMLRTCILGRGFNVENKDELAKPFNKVSMPRVHKLNS